MIEAEELDGLMTVEQVMKRLRISRTTLWAWGKPGKNGKPPKLLPLPASPGLERPRKLYRRVDVDELTPSAPAPKGH